MSPSAIRFYEKRGLMPPSHRDTNGYRSYAAADVRIVQLIDQARSLGFSLRDVEGFMSRSTQERRDKQRLRPILEDKLAVLDQHLAAIERQRQTIVAFIERIDRDAAGTSGNAVVEDSSPTASP